MKNIRVMVVEDDPMISFLHIEVLKRNMIAEDPLPFMNGKEALDFILSDSSDNCYMVLLDINMPVMNGWQFLDKLKDREELASRTKVAILTSSLNPADRAKAGDYELVEYYLSKPLLDYTEIREALDDLKKLFDS